MFAGGVSLSLKSLTLLKWKDEHGKEQTLRLVEKISCKWLNFGLAVDIEEDRLEAWKQQHHEEASGCLLEVMMHWLRSGGCEDYPTTWEGLHQLLVDVGYEKVAEELKTALASHRPSNH